MSRYGASQAIVNDHFAPLLIAMGARGDDPPRELFHYTNFAALKSIVETNTLWATDIRYMNDAHEITYPIEVFRAGFQYACQDLRNEGFHEGVKFLEWLIGAGLRNDGTHQTYVVSFSEREDSLSQWRGYGAKPGISIGFGFLTQFLADDLPLKSVIYDAGKQRTIVADCIKTAVNAYREIVGRSPDLVSWGRTHIATAFSKATAEMLLRFKNPVWNDEAEWRLIVIQNPSAQGSKTFVRESDFGFTPYIHIKPVEKGRHQNGRLPIGSLKIGPTANPELTKRALEIFIAGTEYKENYVTISNSSIPLR